MNNLQDIQDISTRVSDLTQIIRMLQDASQLTVVVSSTSQDSDEASDLGPEFEVIDPILISNIKNYLQEQLKQSVETLKLTEVRF